MSQFRTDYYRRVLSGQDVEAFYEEKGMKLTPQDRQMIHLMRYMLFSPGSSYYGKAMIQRSAALLLSQNFQGAQRRLRGISREAEYHKDRVNTIGSLRWYNRLDDSEREYLLKTALPDYANGRKVGDITRAMIDHFGIKMTYTTIKTRLHHIIQFVEWMFEDDLDLPTLLELRKFDIAALREKVNSGEEI